MKNKPLWICIALLALIAGGVLLYLDWKLLGGALITAGIVCIGVILPPTDTDTTGSSGASDAN